MSDKLTMTFIQMDYIPNDREASLNRAEVLIEDAVKKRAQLVMPSELFNTGHRVKGYNIVLAEPIFGAATQWMYQFAARHHIYIAGAIIESGENGALYSTAAVVGPERFKGKHRKMYLWGGEDKCFGKEERLDVVQLSSYKIGPLVYYEIGLSKVARVQVHKGTGILIYISVFGRVRYYAWGTTSRSKALESGVFVIASNCCGWDKNNVFGGLNRVVGPDTAILASYGAEGDAAVCMQIDLDEAACMRQVLPHLRDMNEKLCNNNF